MDGILDTGYREFLDLGIFFYRKDIGIKNNLEEMTENLVVMS